MEDTFSRRSVLHLLVLGGAVTATMGTLVSACGGGGPSCNDTTGLSMTDLSTRTQNAYVDETADPNKKCSNCNFFVGAGANVCGTCRVVKGTIAPGGYCRLWAVKPA